MRRSISLAITCPTPRLALRATSDVVAVQGVIGGEIEEAQACLNAGADAVLRKPVTVASVARALAAAMERTGRSEAA